MILTDQIWVFPTICAQGNCYVMVMANSDAGLILATRLKLSRKKEQLTQGFTTIYNIFKAAV